MGDFDDRKRMCIDDIKIDERYAPPRDPTFFKKYGEYYEGNIAGYVCVIPIGYVKPYSLTYYPEDWPPFKPYIEELKKKMVPGEHPALMVYQEGRFFIVSDDYPAFYAYLESRQDVVYAFCLGKPDHEALLHLGEPRFNHRRP